MGILSKIGGEADIMEVSVESEDFVEMVSFELSNDGGVGKREWMIGEA